MNYFYKVFNCLLNNNFFLSIGTFEKNCNKNYVRLYYLGCHTLSTHIRYPSTAQCGNYCLLRFRPGPVRSSLSNLIHRKLLSDNHVDIKLSLDD